MSRTQSGSAGILGNYQQVLKQPRGAELVKVDLHVHTPASDDARWKSRYNFEFDRAGFAQSMDKARSIARDIVQRCIQLDLRLIAVTDHNTPSNVHPQELGRSWYELLRDAAAQAARTHGERSPCILPGVEISTDDLHILVILDPGRKDDGTAQPAAYTIHRINALLGRCGFELKEYGDYGATGTSSLFDVLEHIGDLDVRCIAIPAHIDGGNKAMLDVYDKPSNVYAKLLNHPRLNAVEVTKHRTPTHRKLGAGKDAPVVGDYFAAQRDGERSPLAWVQNSDGHSIKPKGLGVRFTYVRMGRPSFTALKNALEDPDTRVRLAHEYGDDDGRTTLLGLAFRKKGGPWGHVAFNPGLNCIIGKRNTQKSTIVDLILYGVDRFHDDERQFERQLVEQGYAAEVFLSRGGEVFCASRGGDGAAPSWWRLGRGSFAQIAGAPEDLALPRKYHHEGITGRFSKADRLMEFIDWDVLRRFAGMEAALTRRDRCYEAVRAKDFRNCAAEMQALQRACEQLFDRRKGIRTMTVQERKSGGRVTGVDIHLAPYGQVGDRPLFMVRVTPGPRSGKDKLRYVDRAKLHVLRDGRYEALEVSRTGPRNAAIMVFLMNQGAFGPLIVDEPEQHLDVASIANPLVPRMRALKTQQQIICVTRDEHILLSGDAEHVIATQREDRIEVVAGDTNDRDIQKEVLAIFEGDPQGRELRTKIRKLDGILHA